MALMKMPTYVGGGSEGKSFFQKYSNLPQTIDIGFVPKYVIVAGRYDTASMVFIYNSDESTTQQIRYYGNEIRTLSIPAPSNYAGFEKVGSDTEIKFNNYYSSMINTYVMAIERND